MLYPIDERGRTFSYTLHRMVQLSPAMIRLVNALNKHGYVDPIRDCGRGTTTGTIVALKDRGILRESKGRYGRHYPATTPEQVYAEACIEHGLRICDKLDADEATPEPVRCGPKPDGGWMCSPANCDRPTECILSDVADGATVGFPWRLETPEEEFNNDAAELLEDQSPHPAPLTVERDCTHGDGCPVHPDTHAVHNFDSDETPEQRAARHALNKPLIEALQRRNAETRRVADATMWSAQDPAPTLADDVAALRKKVIELLTPPNIHGVEMLGRLDRIAGMVPQRATNRLGQPMSVHRPDWCGFVFAGDGWPSCSCGIPGGWQALCTLGGAA